MRRRAPAPPLQSTQVSSELNSEMAAEWNWPLNCCQYCCICKEKSWQQVQTHRSNTVEGNCKYDSACDS